MQTYLAGVGRLAARSIHEDARRHLVELELGLGLGSELGSKVGFIHEDARRDLVRVRGRVRVRVKGEGEGEGLRLGFIHEDARRDLGDRLGIPGTRYVYYGAWLYVYPVRTLLPHSAVSVCPGPDRRRAVESHSDCVGTYLLMRHAACTCPLDPGGPSLLSA